MTNMRGVKKAGTNSRESAHTSAAFRFFRFVFFLFFISYNLWPMAAGLYSQVTELGSMGDLTVLGTDGTVPNPDVEIKGFSIFGSTNLITHISTAPGNTVFNGAVEISSDMYVVGISTFTSPLNIWNPAGASGNLLLISTGASNVIRMNGKGEIYASRFIGDISGTTGITGADNLGNHIATTVLQMGVYGINSSSDITAGRYQIGGSTVLAVLPGTGSLGVGVNAGRVNAGDYNVFVGSSAGYNNVSGAYNSFMGASAGQSNSTGGNNTFVGAVAGSSNDSGQLNTFVGASAGGSNVGGIANSFFGASAGAANSSGQYNTFAGYSAGAANSSGQYNSFFGAYAGQANTASANTFAGYSAGSVNGSGAYNSFVGAYAGLNNTIGANNTVVGSSAGYNTQTGSANAIFGNEAGYGLNANSFSNATIMGYRAGYHLTTGNDNILLGWQAGYAVTSGADNIVIGYGQDTSGATVGNELNIGGVLYGNLSAHTIGVSTRAPAAALDIVSTGTAATQFAQIWRDSTGATVSSMSATGVLMAVRFVGDGSGLTSIAGANDNLGNHIATTVLQMGNWGINSSSSITAGRYQIGGSTVLAISASDSSSMGVGVDAGRINTGAGNSFAGYQAGYLNTTGTSNSFLGAYAGYNNTASYNSFIGYTAGQSNTTGAQNTFVGYNAGNNNNTGGNNSFVGSYAGYRNTTGANNTAVGYGAGIFVQTGSGNAILGEEAGYGQAVNAISSSTLVGYRAGYSLTTGNDNILIGWQAGDSVTSGADNIVIGYNQDTSGATASNELNIGGVLYGNLSAKTIGISTRAPAAALDIVSTGTDANTFAQIWRDSTGVTVSSMSATGVIMAVKFIGDGSGFSRNGDNLGNHTATATLDMSGQSVVNAASGTFSQGITASSFTATGAGLAAARLLLSTVAISSETDAAKGAGVNISSNVYIVGFSSAAKYYGDGSALTGIGVNADTLDNLDSTDFVRKTGSVAETVTGAKTFTSSLTVTNLGGVYASQYMMTAGVEMSSASASQMGGVYVSTNMFIVGVSSATKYYGDGSNLIGVLHNQLATDNLNMNNHQILNISSVTVIGQGIYAAQHMFGANVTLSSAPAAQYGGVYVSTNIYIAGKYYGDASAMSNLPAGDNLGNHIATTVLQMGSWGINSSSSITAGRYQIAGSTVLAISASNRSSIGVGLGAGNVNTASYNTFVGYQAGYTNSTGENNSFVGYQAGYWNTTGAANTFVGYYAGVNNTTGMYNSILGTSAGYASTTGWANSIVGYYAGNQNTTGQNNSIVGAMAAVNNQTGSGNAIFGGYAGYGVAGNSFSSSTLIGYYAGAGLTTGNGNIFIGWQAGDSVTSGADNIVIGYNQDTSASTASNELNIGGLLYGNLSAKTIGISNNAPYAALDIISTGTDANTFAQIWHKSTGGIVSSMSVTGVMQAVRFIGSGAGITNLTAPGDNLGNHTATTVLQMGSWGINSSSAVTAARYQINGSTVLALLPGTGSLGVGVSAGKVNGGADNTFVGTWAGNSNNSGSQNTFVGSGAGYVNTTAAYNTFVGYDAGWNNAVGAAYNTFIGMQAGYNNAGGSYNTFMGASAGLSNTAGQDNTFVGYQAGYNNNAADNTFVGYYAGQNNTTGASNTFVGVNAAAGNITGTNNTVAGYNAFLYHAAGSANAIFGSNAGVGAYGGSQIFSSSTLMGAAAGASLTTGSDNIFIGYQAGNSVTTGADNIVIGYGQDTSASTASNELNIGGVLYGNLSAHTIGISNRTPYAALDIVSTGSAKNQFAQIWRDSSGVINASMSATGVMTAVRFVGDGSGVVNFKGGDNLGNHTATTVLQMGIWSINSSSDISAAYYQIAGSTVLALLPGNYSMGVGSGAGRVNTGDGDVFAGYQAGYNNTSGPANSFFGASAGYTNTTGAYNVFSGAYAGYANTKGTSNSFVGASAGYNNTTGGANTFVGASAGYTTTTSTSDTFVGYNAGYYNTNGSSNTFVGGVAGYNNTTGWSNTLVGYGAGYNNKTGSGNAILGEEAGYGSGTSSFSSSTLIGYRAGYSLTTGSNNVFLGWQAGDTVTTGSGNIVIGYNQDISGATASNELNIGGLLYGNLSAGTIGIGIRPPAAALDIVSTGTAATQFAQIWRGSSGVVQASMSATGVMMAVKFVGDGSGLTNLSAGDNLGNHTATKTLQMGAYGINTSSDITANSYQIAGDTVLDVLAVGSIGVGLSAGPVNYSGGTSAGTQNTYVGFESGLVNVNGMYSTIVGAQAGRSVTTGTGNNTFVGTFAGSATTSGYYNTFVGAQAGRSNTTGGSDTAVGTYALINGGSNNVALGYQATYTNTGSYNVALGVKAGGYNSGVAVNNATLIGYYAGQSLQTSNDNIFIGYEAGNSVTTGSDNIVIGYNQNPSGAAANYELNIGGVLYGNLSAKTIGVGIQPPSAALDVVSTGTALTQFAQIWRDSTGATVSSMSATGVMMAARFVGSGSGLTSLPGGDNLGNHTATTVLQMGNFGVNSSSAVTAARYQINGSTVLAILAGDGTSLGVGVDAGRGNTTGVSNSYVGYQAGLNNTTGAGNSFVGYQAGLDNTTGAYNTFVGAYAGHEGSTGLGYGSFIGYQAGYYNTTGVENTFVGAQAGRSNTTGENNTIMGFRAGYSTQTGSLNAIFGYFAGYGSGTNSFSSSTLMGYRAGYSLTTGNDNILIGWQAGDAITTGADNIVIGYNQDTSGATASNELNIGGVLYGNLSAKTIGISTRAPAAALDIVGTGTDAATFAQIWRDSNGVIKASMSVTGVMQAVRFVGNGSGLTNFSGDNLGNHTATTVLQMGSWGINSSSAVSAGYYQINGSTVLAILAGSASSLGVGVDAGKNNASAGNSNVMVGYQAGYNNTTWGDTFVGYQAGYNDSSGGFNTFAGNLAGYSNTAGAQNVFVGSGAGYSNTTGLNNAVVGSSAAYTNTTGSSNTVMGTNANFWNMTGSADSIFGYQAGGYAAGQAKSFSSSTIMGYQAGYSLDAGANDNIFVGWQAGYNVTIGTGNIVIGYAQDVSNINASNELNIGGLLYGNLSAKTIGISVRAPAAALDIVSTGTAQNQFAQIWRDSGSVIKASMSVTGVMQAVRFVGNGAGLTNVTNYTGVGDNLGNHIATTTLQMVNFGINTSSSITAARYQINGSTVLAVLPGTGSFGIGLNAGQANVAAAAYNTFVGYQAGFSNNSGTPNTFVGANAGYSNTTGSLNTFVGYNSGYNNAIGSNDTIFGSSAAYGASGSSFSNSTIVGAQAGYSNTTGSGNSVFGSSAAYYNQTGSANIIFGANAGGLGSGGVNSFSSSTIIGYQAGYNLTTGNDNVFIGWQAGDSVTSGSDNIVIGYNQDVSGATASNELNIGGVLYGNLSAHTIGIATRTPAAALDIVSTGTAATQFAQIWRDSGGTIKSSMSATGVMMATLFVGDASGLTGFGADNLGNHTAVTTLQMGIYGVNSSSSIVAGRYQIAGSTVLAVLPGSGNLGVGVNAGNSTTTGINNTFAGYNAGYNTQTGSANAVFGSSAGYGASGSSFSSSTIVGSQAGAALTTGGGNIIVGFKAGFDVTSGTGNIVIGYSTGVANGNNQINIGGVYKGDIGAGTATIPKYTVRAVTADTTASFGETLTVNASGAVIVNLPSVTSADIGATITVVKLGAGRVTIDAPGGTVIEDSSDGGTIYNTAVSPAYATITLRLISATQWMIVGGEGAWITT